MGYQVSFIRGKRKANDSSVCFGSLPFLPEDTDVVSYFFCIPQSAWDNYIILLTDLGATFDFSWRETPETEGYYVKSGRHLDLSNKEMRYVTIKMSDSQFVTKQHRLFVLTWMRLGHEFSELLVDWDGKDYNYFFDISEKSFYSCHEDDEYISPNSDRNREHYVCDFTASHKKFTSFLDQHEFYIKQKSNARVCSFLQ